MPLNARSCPECSRVISAQGLPNHRRFVHKAPLGAAAPAANTGDGESEMSPVLVIVLVAVAVAAVVLVATYTLWRCPHCSRLSVVRRSEAVTTCPKCQAAVP
jgi:hypothetical protein